MAYSLLFNSRIIYYSNPSRSAEGYDEVIALLRSDNDQLKRSPKDLLASADCFKASDKAFIYSVIDRNFDSRADMVNTIKAFIQSDAQSSGSAADNGLHQQASTYLSAADEIEMETISHDATDTPYQLMEA